MIFPFGLDLAFTVSPLLLWIVFAVLCIFYGVMSMIFMYHWNKHGHGKILFVRSVYFVVTISLLALIAILILLYSQSI